jgi:thiol-disulfide isomerase/thioredoxin
MKQLSFLILGVMLTGCFGITPQKTGKEGKPMPEFTLMLANNTVLYTRDIPVGKPVVLFYFSPYCPHCKAVTQEIVEEMDDLNNIQFYFVSNFSFADLEGFKKNYQLFKYPNIIIGIDTTHFMNDYFSAVGVPYTAIFSKNKILNNSFMGKISAAQLKKVAEE